MTVVGVTDEPKDSPEKVKKYIADYKVEYTMALQGGRRYSSRGIPAYWLVSPSGKILLEGHPGRDKDAIDKAVQEYVIDAFFIPAFDLPDDLARAEKYLNAGLMSKGIREIEKHIEDSEPANREAASEALKRVQSFGDSQIDRAIAYSKEGRFASAQTILERIEKMFRGTPTADRAKEQLREWRKDPVVKKEIAAEKLYRAARDAIYEKRDTKTASYLLSKIAKGKKYEGLQMRRLAEAKLKEIGSE